MIIDHCRDIEELRKLYNDRPMPNQYEFDWLINNPNLFCFYENNKLLGFITMQDEEFENIGKVLTLSGTSIRKNLPNIITAINKVCDAFHKDIYSYTPLKEAAYVLKKANFKKIGTNLYMRFKNG